jgi:hypothetical protein
LDDNDCTTNYPIAEEYRAALHAIKPKWHVTPLPAFDTRDEPICSPKMTATLKESLVLVHFNLKHFSISEKKKKTASRNVFTATPTHIKILKYNGEHQPALSS